MRQLEQAKQEHSSTTTTTAAAASTAASSVTESSNASEEMQSTSTFNETADRLGNGYPVETPVITEN